MHRLFFDLMVDTRSDESTIAGKAPVRGVFFVTKRKEVELVDGLDYAM